METREKAFQNVPRDHGSTTLPYSEEVEIAGDLGTLFHVSLC